MTTEKRQYTFIIDNIVKHFLVRRAGSHHTWLILCYKTVQYTAKSIRKIFVQYSQHFPLWRFKSKTPVGHSPRAFSEVYVPDREDLNDGSPKRSPGAMHSAARGTRN